MDLIQSVQDMMSVKKAGEVTIKKPFYLSKKWLTMLIVPIVVITNKKFHLDLENQEIQAIALAVAAYVAGQAWVDGSTNAAAIHSERKE